MPPFFTLSASTASASITGKCFMRMPPISHLPLSRLRKKLAFYGHRTESREIQLALPGKRLALDGPQLRLAHATYHRNATNDSRMRKKAVADSDAPSAIHLQHLGELRYSLRIRIGFVIKEIRIANKTLKDVQVKVVQKMVESWVIGQKTLKEAGNFEFDTKERKLIFK